MTVEEYAFAGIGLLLGLLAIINAALARRPRLRAERITAPASPPDRPELRQPWPRHEPQLPKI